MDIQLKRAYASPGPEDGYRALVDRLWPRGVKKSAAHIDEWWKEGAPSVALRQWFGHDPAKWRQFRERYAKELEANREAVSRFIERAAPGPVTLVYGARDEQHNHAIVLKEFMESSIARSRGD